MKVATIIDKSNMSTETKNHIADYLSILHHKATMSDHIAKETAKIASDAAAASIMKMLEEDKRKKAEEETALREQKAAAKAAKKTKQTSAMASRVQYPPPPKAALPPPPPPGTEGDEEPGVKVKAGKESDAMDTGEEKDKDSKYAPQPRTKDWIGEPKGNSAVADLVTPPKPKDPAVENKLRAFQENLMKRDGAIKTPGVETQALFQSTNSMAMDGRASRLKHAQEEEEEEEGDKKQAKRGITAGRGSRVVKRKQQPEDDSDDDDDFDSEFDRGLTVNAASASKRFKEEHYDHRNYEHKPVKETDDNVFRNRFVVVKASPVAEEMFANSGMPGSYMVHKDLYPYLRECYMQPESRCVVRFYAPSVEADQNGETHNRILTCL